MKTKPKRGGLGCALGMAALGAALAGRARAQDGGMTEEKLRQEAINERFKAIEDRLNSPDNLRVYWKDGLKFTTPDNKIDLQIGGRLHFESEWNKADQDLENSSRYNADSGDTGAGKTTKIGPLEDGMEVRRARLYIKGTIYDHFEFKFQYDFAKGATAEKDVYCGFYNLGDWVPNVRAGHQYEPMGLDAMTSSNDSTFVERSMISNAIAPNRNPGFLLWKNFKFENSDGVAEERITWAAGVFRNDTSDNGVASGDGAYDLAARITGTPFWENKGQRMVHVGASAMRRSVTGRGTQSVTYASNPEVDLFPSFVSTGAMKSADVDSRYGTELAFVWNNWSMQGEYMWTKTKMSPVTAPTPINLDDPSFSGWYAQASYMLTGESRRFKPAEAVFQNPKPWANAFDNGGMGAWELALRYSTLDLTDGNKASGGVEGGSIETITLGLNWYFNNNVRVMWDLSRADLNVDDAALGKGGDALIAQMRVQFAF